MKIAVVTDDGKTISRHFGRALHYLVYEIENGVIVRQELRDKVGHHHAAGEPHQAEHGTANHAGPEADHKHNQMLASIEDCEAVIVRGMGWGAYQAVEQAKLRPFITDIEATDEAVQAYIDGKLIDHPEKLH